MLEEINASYRIRESIPFSTQVPELVSEGKVPILLDHYHFTRSSQAPFTLYESTTINTYVGEDTPLVPEAGTLERALYDQTIATLATEMDAQGLWMHQKHVVKKRYFGEMPHAVLAARTQCIRTTRQLAQQLNPYLLGDNFTAADITFVHCLDWSETAGWDKYWPKGLLEYRRRCHARPAYQKTHAIWEHKNTVFEEKYL